MKKISVRPNSIEALISPAMLRGFQIDLPAWFRANKRDLPWRRLRNPYRVWISELMLQQTRVDQATPFFERFMVAFPDVIALANAPLEQVLKLWEGLGYYQRARRAHETARYLVECCAGEFPRTYGALLQLPGVGPYTAAAIASLAFGGDYAVLDGNVARVLARVFAVNEPSAKPSTRRAMASCVDHLLPKGNAATFNEAIMELGALICLPNNPKCGECPLRLLCHAHRKGEENVYPVRLPVRRVPHRHVGAGVIIDDRERVLIAQRKETSMLAGLWEFPGGGVEEGETLPVCIRRELREELNLDVRVGPLLITVRHAFSHFTMDLHAYWVRVTRGRPKALGCSAWRWVDVAQIRDYPLPRADQKVLAALLEAKEWPTF